MLSMDLKGATELSWVSRDAYQKTCSSVWLATSSAEHQLVFIIPEFPVTGFCTCYPVSGGPSFRACLKDCRQFTGLYDVSDEPIFAGDRCSIKDWSFCEKGTVVRNVRGTAWTFKRESEGAYYSLTEVREGGILLHRLQSLEKRSLRYSEEFTHIRLF